SWRNTAARIRRANETGVRMGGQALPRGIGMLFGLTLSAHPFFLKPSYRAISHLPIGEQLARMRDPDLRARILSEESIKYPLPVANTLNLFDGMFEVDDPFDYEPSPQSSVTARAAAMGLSPAALAYDLLVSHGAEPALFLPFANYAAGNLDTALEMFRHP